MRCSSLTGLLSCDFLFIESIIYKHQFLGDSPAQSTCGTHFQLSEKMASTADSATDTLNPPALTLPRGLVSNFSNPYNRGYILTVVGSLLISLMIIFVGVRMYAKARIQKKWWWDDCTYITILAILRSIG